MFSGHVNEFDNYVVEFFVVFKLNVGFDAFVVSVPNVDRLLNSITLDVFDVWVSHQRVNRTETHKISLSMVQNFIP